MVKILEMMNMSYKKFQNICLNFETGYFYTIVGCNNSGKTTLLRILSSFYETNNMIMCNNILLNGKNRMMYLKQIGVVKKLDSNSFFCQRVLDELELPLINLGYRKEERRKRINKILNVFNLDNAIDKNIANLSAFERQKLLFVISLLHYPKVLLIDDALELLKKSEKQEIIESLLNLKKEGLTILHFTSNLENVFFDDKEFLLYDYKIIKFNIEDLFKNDKFFIDHHLDMPFICDLSNKLKLYDIVNRDYLNLEEMVNDIWP